MANILVVDDAVDSAETLALLFEAMGHEAHVAFDGSAGLAQAKKHVPHIIFLDLDMPILDGYGAARAIREAPDTDHPFMVALTGQGGDDVVRKTVAAGFDFYIRKPANAKDLLALVDHLKGRDREAQPCG